MDKKTNLFYKYLNAILGDSAFQMEFDDLDKGDIDFRCGYNAAISDVHDFFFTLFEEEIKK